MRFESFISALDMGHCEDQLQREALFDLALMFVMVDGVVTESETEFMQDWLKTISWTSDDTKEQYYLSAAQKCFVAIEQDDVDDFIAHRATQLVDKSIKKQAIKLAKDIAQVDGQLDPKELAAIAQLVSILDK
jgi:tellurite resistance protein